MKPILRSSLVVATGLAMLVSLTAPAPADTSHQRAAASYRSIPTLAPPTGLTVGLVRHGSGFTASVTARVSTRPLAVATRDADRVLVQVRVRDPRSGRLIEGDVQTAFPNASSGRVGVRLPLSPAQGAALEAGILMSGATTAVRLVRVRVIAESDLSSAWPGREARSVVERGAAWGLPAEGESDAFRSGSTNVTVENATGSPLALLSGPVQCIYDNAYASTEKVNQQSFLGSMNGTVLPAGSSLTVAITKDDDSLDGYYNDFDYHQVLADYEQSLQNGYAWLQAAGTATLPQAGFPYSSDNPMGLPYQFWQSIGLFAGHAVIDMLSASGLWATTLLRLQSQYPELAASFAAADAAFGPVIDVVNAVFEVVIAIVEGLISLVSDGCGSNAGYFLIGATDLEHPWRSFAQVYNWNGGDVDVAYDSQAKKSYTAYANGMITQSVGIVAPIIDDPVANALNEVLLPQGQKGSPVFTFLEPPNRAESPAVITVDAATRRVTCALAAADQSALSANLAQQMSARGTSQYLVSYPIALWGDLSTGTTGQVPPPAASYPYDYLVGYQYTAPEVAARLGTSTATVYWSPDGSSFQSSVPIPAGQTSVVLPASSQGQAKLVTCVVQAGEMWNAVDQSPLPTKRGVIMGTLVPSDVVQGPDYPQGG